MQKGAQHSVKVMAVGKDVLLKMDARRVCMGVLCIVLIMVVGRDVLWLNALRVLGVGQTSAYAMAGGKGANMKDVIKVHKAELTFARGMEEGNGALGASQGLVVRLLLLAISLLGGSQAYVLHTVPR